MALVIFSDKNKVAVAESSRREAEHLFLTRTGVRAHVSSNAAATNMVAQASSDGQEITRIDFADLRRSIIDYVDLCASRMITAAAGHENCWLVLVLFIK